MSTTANNQPKYSVDFSKSKYESRYDRILNILYYSKEIPSDLHLHMYMSYDNFRKAISTLKSRGLIRRISKDRKLSYVLTLKGKKQTRLLNYMKYQDCLEDEQYQYDVRHRSRRLQFAYLYALFDRVGISYETFRKPSLNDVNIFDDHICFYTATDFKRSLKMDSISLKGSRVMGFLIGAGKIVAVYRTNQELKSFTSVEKLIPFFMKQRFSVSVNTAILICNDSSAVADISDRIIRNTGNDPKVGINTADYRCFYVLPGDDTFLDRLKDIYADHTLDEQRIIRQYDIDTSEEDSEGRYRLKIGTGFIHDYPVLVCTGNVNMEVLKRFIRSADLYQQYSYILCKERDRDELENITRDYPIRVIAIDKE